jgi:prevent-host-death family protein
MGFTTKILIPFLALAAEGWSSTGYGKRGIHLTCDLFKDYIRSIIQPREVNMKLSRQIRPISYLKAHAAEIVRTLREGGQPLIITQNGEAKAVLQDIESFEQAQETMALLKIIALGARQIEEGKVQPAADVIARLRKGREAL